MKKISAFIFLTLFLATIVLAQRYYTTNGKYIGAKTIEDLELGIKTLREKKIDQFKALLDSGRVFKLNEGVEVYLMETFQRDVVKLKIKDTDLTFYTVFEEIGIKLLLPSELKKSQIKFNTC